jgi:hypothetical protein
MSSRQAVTAASGRLWGEIHEVIFFSHLGATGGSASPI